MTVLEALKQAIETLNGVSIPVPQLHSIGMPIDRATSLIQASIDALEKNVKTEEEPEDEETEEAESKESEET